jgi:hypothetical protein
MVLFFLDEVLKHVAQLWVPKQKIFKIIYHKKKKRKKDIKSA